MNSCSIVYHYTTISGLIGIISGKKLWASDCQFLNDGTELSYARDIFFSELNILNLPHIEGGGYIIPALPLDTFYMFITCFCENGDLLSQWRGYGLNQGYSLGFDVSLLKLIDNIDGVIPVEYGITNPSKYFAHELEFATHRTAHPEMSAYNATRNILPRLVKIKNPCFKEEKEWRLLKQFTEEINEDQEILFRKSSNGPIPYQEISFPRECLTEVIIGPGEHIDIREKAIRKILNYYEFWEVTIRISEIPFR